MATPNLTDREILARLADAMKSADDVIPKGFRHTGDFAKSWGKSSNYAHAILTNGAKSGLVEKVFVKKNGKRMAFFRFKG